MDSIQSMDFGNVAASFAKLVGPFGFALLQQLELFEALVRGARQQVQAVQTVLEIRQARLGLDKQLPGRACRGRSPTADLVEAAARRRVARAGPAQLCAAVVHATEKVRERARGDVVDARRTEVEPAQRLEVWPMQMQREDTAFRADTL